MSAERARDPLYLAFTTQQCAHRVAEVAPPPESRADRRGHRNRGTEHCSVILGEDRGFEPAELGARLDADLFDQDVASLVNARNASAC